MGRRLNSNRNDAGSLLASLFILVLGGMACLFTVAAMAPDSVPMAAGIVGGVAAALILLVVMVRFGKSPGSSLQFLLTSRRSHRDDGAADYEPRRAGDQGPQSSGTNRPITASEAQEIRITSANTWVPAKGRKKR